MADLMPKTEVEPAVFTLNEVATYLHVHESTVRRLLKRGALPGGFKIGKDWRFDKHTIDKWRLEQKGATSVYGTRRE